MMNSFKRGIGYQIAKIVVALVVAFIIALLTGKVHAEVDFNFKEEKTLWNTNKAGQVRISQPSSAGGFNQIANLSFDTSYTNTQGYKYAVFYGTWLFYNSGNAAYTYDLRLLTIQMNSSNQKASNCFFDGGTRLICPIVKDATYVKLSIFLPYTNDLYSSITGGGNSVNTTLYLNYTLLRFVQFGNDNLSSGEQEIANSVKETNDTIKSDDIGSDSDNSSKVNEWNSSTASNGTITQLITLPITLYTSILNNINGSCTSFNLGSLYGSNLTMSCIRIQDYVGSTLWGVIDMLFSGFFILIISKKMIKVFNNISSMKEGDILD